MSGKCSFCGRELPPDEDTFAGENAVLCSRCVRRFHRMLGSEGVLVGTLEEGTSQDQGASIPPAEDVAELLRLEESESLKLAAVSADAGWEAFREYLALLRSKAPVQAADEAERLLVLALHGDRDARRRWIESLVELVALLAASSTESNENPLDTVQDMNDELISLLDAYSPSDDARQNGHHKKLLGTAVRRLLESRGI